MLARALFLFLWLESRIFTEISILPLKQMIKRIFTALAALAMSLSALAQSPDPNFHIYLCFGQSNMEAGARPAPEDEGFNDPRFQFMAAVDMPRYNREMGKWYTAVPPICREGNNMGPVDFFGRKMIENLPEEVRVGVINVSVAGAKLELWDKDACEEYLAAEAADPSRGWLVNIAKAYGMSPYQRLLDMARIAQKDGVIKGMLLHQGESNPDDAAWPGRPLRRSGYRPGHGSAARGRAEIC